MFNTEFYPTPKKLIKQLFKPYFKENTSYYDFDGAILDPSAGKGDLLAFIQENVKYRDIEYFGIEINPDLQEILRSKQIPVIDADFLNFKDDYHFDYIVMNPPFSNGIDHLLKAVEIAGNTKIACILNAETIKNPYSKKRKKLIEIINQYGHYEFVKDALIEAERKTNVEVVLIWLDLVDESSKFDFNFFTNEEKKINFDFDIQNDAIARIDLIDNLNYRYEEVRMAYVEKLKADAKFEHYYNQFINGEGWRITGDAILKNGTPQKKYTYFSRKLKSFMWRQVISHLNIKKYMSSEVIKKFEIFISQQSKMSFNKENVFNFLDMIMNNRKNIIETAIIDVFDNLTSHAYTANRLYMETWKTNSAYMIKKKIISPAHIRYGEYSKNDWLKVYGDNFSLGYDDWNYSKLNDLDKVLCYISGRDYDRITTIKEALERKFEILGRVKVGDKIDTSCTSTFFKIKFYRKGTIHLVFRDDKLLQEFNYRACAAKNWLPADEKRKWQESKKQSTELVPTLF